MRSLPSEVLQALRSNELRPFMLLTLDIPGRSTDEPLRYTDCDFPLYLDHLYKPRGFEVSALQYSSGFINDNLNLELDNLDDLLTPVFVDGNPQGASVDLHFVLVGTQDERSKGSYLLLADGTRLEIAPDGTGSTDPGAWRYEIVGNARTLLFGGEIDSWELSEGSISCEVLNRYSRWDQKTLRVQAASCPWRFGSPECGHVVQPGENCFKTHKECVGFGNVASFGGFRWLPSLDNKEITWGRTSK
ncbi:hypothetical protein V6C53_16890 [Desulfocurvibacter africanus]|uniref:hypothetical protein n=1 Tax=Desulfocurvibacter africanus TaxID=873 RepID=UPI002FD8E8DA